MLLDGTVLFKGSSGGLYKRCCWRELLESSLSSALGGNGELEGLLEGSWNGALGGLFRRALRRVLSEGMVFLEGCFGRLLKRCS